MKDFLMSSLCWWTIPRSVNLSHVLALYVSVTWPCHILASFAVISTASRKVVWSAADRMDVWSTGCLISRISALCDMSDARGRCPSVSNVGQIFFINLNVKTRHLNTICFESISQNVLKYHSKSTYWNGKTIVLF